MAMFNNQLTKFQKFRAGTSQLVQEVDIGLCLFSQRLSSIKYLLGAARPSRLMPAPADFPPLCPPHHPIVT